MLEFFAGNTKRLYIAKQVDSETPVEDLTVAKAFDVYDFTKNNVRNLAALSETDRSAQRPGPYVSAVTPGLSFGCYGRPSELALLLEALLGDNDDSATVDPTTHTATPALLTPYYTILEENPWGNTRYESCRLGAIQFAADGSSDVPLKLTGIAFEAAGLTRNIDSPSPAPLPSSEQPFEYPEVTVNYDGSSSGRTQSFQVTVQRNLSRQQGDAGFRAIGLTYGLFQIDAQVTRYLEDDAIGREVDTGSPTGTTPTTAIATHSFSIRFNRGTGPDNRQFLLSIAEIAFTDDSEQLQLDGGVQVEVLGMQSIPQEDLADHVAAVTVNDEATTNGDG